MPVEKTESLPRQDACRIQEDGTASLYWEWRTVSNSDAPVGGRSHVAAAPCRRSVGPSALTRVPPCTPDWILVPIRQSDPRRTMCDLQETPRCYMCWRVRRPAVAASSARHTRQSPVKGLAGRLRADGAALRLLWIRAGGIGRQ